MIGSYRGIIFRLTHNFCALHFVQVPQLCGHLAVIAGQRQTKGLQHKAGVPFPCLILIGCSLLQPLQNQTRAGFATAIQGAARCRPQLPGGGKKSRQKLAAPRRVSNPPHGTGNCAPTLTSTTSKASSASMGSQVAMACFQSRLNAFRNSLRDVTSCRRPRHTAPGWMPPLSPPAGSTAATAR